MDTQDTINDLQTLSDNLGAEAGITLNRKAAIDTAIAQLKGILQTQDVAAAAALADAAQALTDAGVAVPDSVAALVPDATAAPAPAPGDATIPS